MASNHELINEDFAKRLLDDLERKRRAKREGECAELPPEAGDDRQRTSEEAQPPP